jgi:hypothetical protein
VSAPLETCRSIHAPSENCIAIDIDGSDTFVYEYIGEVIPHNTFARRIKEYADVGIEHFYFMQLQKDEVRCPRPASKWTNPNMRTVHRCDTQGRPRSLSQSLVPAELLRR